MTRWLSIVFLIGCVEADAGLGERCSRSSQCDQPLVCRLEACRNECASSRDCPIGSVCLRDESGSGSCRLQSEEACAGDSECPASLVCVDDACTNACTADGDCTPGAACLDGGCAFVDQRCISDRDCTGGSVCVMGICASQCVSNRDCRFGSSCESGRCIPGDAGPRPDVPMLDAPVDAPTTGSFLEGATSIAAGFSHSCASVAGNLHCWGSLPPYGSSPQLGTPHPTCTPLAEGAEAVASSGNQYCARVGGTLRCGGESFAGLGDGSTMESLEPVSVSMLSAVTGFTVGGPPQSPATYACAIEGGEVFCWGTNFAGQLGNGTTTNEALPVSTGLTDVTQVDAGHTGACAINADRELWCWGTGVPAGTEGNVPVQLSGVRATHVSLSRGRGLATSIAGCLVDDAMEVQCWTLDGSLAAVGVTATQVAVGGEFVCALQMDATISCWGSNGQGQIGSGTTESMVAAGTSQVRTMSGVLTGVDEVIAGGWHACARVADTVWCWGRNQYGELGGYGTTPSSVAVQVRCVR